jgi:hypothetical protein
LYQKYRTIVITHIVRSLAISCNYLLSACALGMTGIFII